jgi:hypothetical protein
LQAVSGLLRAHPGLHSQTQCALPPSILKEPTRSFDASQACVQSMIVGTFEPAALAVKFMFAQKATDSIKTITCRVRSIVVPSLQNTQDHMTTPRTERPLFLPEYLR